MNEYIKKFWQVAFSFFPPSFFSTFLFFPLLSGCWMPIRFTAFVPTPSRTCRISRCYRSMTTRSKPSPRAPSLHYEQYRPCEWNTHTHWNTHTLLYTLWHMLIRYHKTWANTGVVYLQVCVITQEWNHEVERWVNLSSSQTPRHTHTQLLQLDRDQKQHIYHTQSFHHCYGDNTNSLKLMSPFFCPKQQGNTNTAINTDTRRASKIYSIRFSHCHRNTCWGW